MSLLTYQNQIPWIAAAQRPLPGVQPLGDLPWLIRGDDYAVQMTERARLIRDHFGDVAAQTDLGSSAVDELKSLVINAVGHDADVNDAAPLASLALLAQEDFCILVKQGAQHVLAAALVCFPASWQLKEKMGKPMTDIHAPVESYAPVAQRVERLFDGVQVGRPLWRANVLWYEDPALFQPRSVSQPRRMPDCKARFLRSERQVILRLPETRAVVFSIRTKVVPV
ncbi:DUF3445 domain-containing protein [Nereida sp. MMG025]|uniref:heme-dependent oxidative N-demethylase family protein n=1 Tax=Nereida sp. MMG025 TaxID=2909981 RepID=UPI001F1B248D|nr:DUF3445 domain-containing protein [Nereida sp. MMG025]MCF6443384.1 DUF3445 domain-containing protein [Nereida sp. MMG025]